MQAAKHAKQALTSDQERGAVGAKLVPEGGEEVDELEDLATSFASCKRIPEAGGDQEQHKACQKPYCLQQQRTFQIPSDSAGIKCVALQQDFAKKCDLAKTLDNSQ